MTNFMNNMESLQSIVASINTFSARFYKVLSENTENNNSVCCPISLSLALSMVMFGARGETKEELRTGLQHFGEDEDIKREIVSLTDILKNDIKSNEFRFANNIFPAIGFDIKPEFEMCMKTSFQSKTQCIDFSKITEACNIINKWCEEQTKNCIKDAVKSDDINVNTTLVLINAVYFKGTWKDPFEVDRTQSRSFHIDKKTTKYVPMMNRTGYYNYGKVPKLDAHYIELPYKSNSESEAISMFVILPNTIDGLQKIEHNLDKINYKELHEQRNVTDINLQLPKFKIVNKIDLREVLKKMCMGNMFTVNADFREITELQPLYVSKVLQKAFLEVNEKGTEAAAITAVIRERSLPRKVVVDRPFFCVIFATHIGIPIFYAKIIDPVATETS